MNGKHHTAEARASGDASPGATFVHSLQSIFGIDPRSLAVFRISVAGILLLDLWYRSRDIGPFFTDDGILPRHVLISLNEMLSLSGFEHIWSLHMFSGQYWAQQLLIVVAAFFAIWMLFGYRTRLASIVSWVLLLSLDSRNPDILNSGDVLLRCMLLWSLFLPLGGVWSVDRLIKRPQSELPRRLTSVASAALLLQLAMMYFFSAIAKLNPVWYSEFSGVYYALHCDAYTKPLGLHLREYSGLTKLLTAGAFGLEFVGPIIVFLPLFTGRIRIVMVAMFWLFHIGLSVTMTLGLFPVICMAAWTVYLPAEFWDRLVPKLLRSGRGRPLRTVSRRFVQGAVGLRRLTRRGRSPFLARAEIVRWRQHPIRSWMVNGTLAILLVYVVLWNVREVVLSNARGTDDQYWVQRILPAQLNGVGRVLGLDQNWGMFSPIPRTEDGWLVMKGTLRDGTVVNLWQNDRELPWSKPRYVSETYISQRWRKYLDNLSTDFYALRRLDFCEWLGNRWNERLGPGDRSRQVVLIELFHCIEATPPPGQPFPELETRSLYEYRPLLYE